MAFLLPSIYKPFYINVLFVRKSYFEFFVIIDVYNGIGLYDQETRQYHIGDIHVTFEEVDGTQREEILHIYRDKFLFNTSYRESITTVFTGFTTTNVGNSQRLIVEYKSPVNKYDVKINRDITLAVDLKNVVRVDEEPFYLYHNEYGGYNIWYDKNEYGINGTLAQCVRNKDDESNKFLYYVVNEGFYKYFINPFINKANSYIYQSYNNDEVEGLSGDTQRIEYDLNPSFVNYNDDNGKNYLPIKEKYNNSNINYCITTPFFRMYPSISSYPKEKQAPFAVRLVESDSTIVLENNIEGYLVDKNNLKYNNFYLIGVKSPLTSLSISENNYDNKDNDKLIRPEQDYVTFIECVRRIKVLKEDDNGYLVPEENYEYKYE